MILAEESIVLARANSELAERMNLLSGRQRKQTEILSGLLTTTDFGLPSTYFMKRYQAVRLYWSFSICRELIPGLLES